MPKDLTQLGHTKNITIKCRLGSKEDRKKTD
jgi:hypothetical protein